MKNNTRGKLLITNAKFFIALIIFITLLFACGKDKSNVQQNNTSAYNKSNYEYGLEALDKKDYDQARKYFEKINKKDKNFKDAHSKINYIIGYQEYIKKEYESSLEHFNEVLSSDSYFYYACKYTEKINYILNKMNFAYDLYENDKMDSALKIIEKIPTDDFDYQKSLELKYLIQATNYKRNGYLDSSIIFLEKITSESIYSNISDNMIEEIKGHIDSNYYNSGVAFFDKLEFDSAYHYFNKVNYLTDLVESSEKYKDSAKIYKDTLLFAKTIYYLDKVQMDSSILYFKKVSDSYTYYNELNERIKNILHIWDKEKTSDIFYISSPFVLIGLLTLYLSSVKVKKIRALAELRNLFLLTDFELNDNIEYLVKNIIIKNKISQKKLVIILLYILKEDIINNKHHFNTIHFNNKIDAFKKIIEDFESGSAELSKILQTDNIK